MAQALRTLDIITAKSPWFNDPDIRPYVFVRPDNRIPMPGSRHRLDWFNSEVIYKNPLDHNELPFAECIYYLEEAAFGTAMAMPRWVFYDCAVIPGFVAGYAIRTEALRNNPKWKSVSEVIPSEWDRDWTPLSLFIIIPTVAKGQWVAHNLCSVNSLIGKNNQFYGLGFLSKAFGLWYANVERCLGITQWGSVSVKLHSHYGHFQVVTAYTPIHTKANTLTYELDVNTNSWEQFFTREADLSFLEICEATQMTIDPKSVESMKAFHQLILEDENKYFLSSHEIGQKKIDDPLTIYKLKPTRE